MIFKDGIVWESKPGFARVHFDEEDTEETSGETGFTSDWLPVMYTRTFKDGECWPLEKGEQVRCILDQDCNQGVILGAMFDESNTPGNGAASGMRTIYFEDGTVISYKKGIDTAQGELNADIKGNVTIKASGTLNADITGEATIKSKKFIIDGDMEVKGEISATKDISSSTEISVGTGPLAIKLTSHKHIGVQTGGGTSGTPIP